MAIIRLPDTIDRTLNIGNTFHRFLFSEILCNIFNIIFAIILFLLSGLNYQIEHHLWPTLPRHSVSSVPCIFTDFSFSFEILSHDTAGHMKYAGNAQWCTNSRFVFDIFFPRRGAKKVR